MTVHFDLPAWVGPLFWTVVAVVAVVVVVGLAGLVRGVVVWARQR